MLLISTIFFTCIFGNMTNVNAQSFFKVDIQSESIVEHLKLNVPKAFVEAWLNAEKKSWEPWLIKQDGFLGRQLFLGS